MGRLRRPCPVLSFSAAFTSSPGIGPPGVSCRTLSRVVRPDVARTFGPETPGELVLTSSRCLVYSRRTMSKTRCFRSRDRSINGTYVRLPCFSIGRRGRVAHGGSPGFANTAQRRMVTSPSGKHRVTSASARSGGFAFTCASSNLISIGIVVSPLGPTRPRLKRIFVGLLVGPRSTIRFSEQAIWTAHHSSQSCVIAASRVD